jgi:hypothetical protein
VYETASTFEISDEKVIIIDDSWAALSYQGVNSSGNQPGRPASDDDLIVSFAHIHPGVLIEYEKNFGL